MVDANNNLISRSDAAALIPEEVANAIIQGTPEASLALSVFRQVSMARGQQRIPVIAALPTAYWVGTPDTGLKRTSEVNWTNKYLEAAELAVIVPIPENVLDDTSFDVWGEVRPRISEAIGAALDAAVFFGNGTPGEWSADPIVTAAIAAGQAFQTGGVGTDLADDTNALMGLVEANGFPVNGFLGAPTMKAAYRGLRSAVTGDLLYVPGLASAAPGTLFGESVRFGMNGAWDISKALMIAGDFRQGMIGVRKDITWKVLDQAVIQDGDGNIVYNLAQQDMVALRVTARFAFQVPNPVTRLNAAGYPFAVLQPA